MILLLSAIISWKNGCYLLLLFSCVGVMVVDANEPLKVVFIGKYRSGSSSMSAALRKLGYNPCHGREMVDNVMGSHSRLANAFIEGNVTEILQITSALGCNASMELHAVLWKQIVDRMPEDTKFIIVLRPKEDWMKSVINFHVASAPIYRFPLRFIPVYGKLSKLFSTLAMTEGGWDSRDKALAVMRRPLGKPMRETVERVYSQFAVDIRELMRKKPKHTLLFDLQEGYPPLCKFLGVKDCPEEPFPHIHRSSDVKAKYSLPRKQEVIINTVLVVAVLAMVILGWIGQRRKINKSKIE